MTVTETEAAAVDETGEVVETRSGGGFEVAEVNFPKRIVTVVAMPYERPAEINTPRGRFTEVVSRGAFDGIEKRSGQIRTYRDHAYTDVVGKVVGLHPSRKEGLVTDVKVFSTLLGDETLTLCDQGGLDASVGFSLLRRDDGRVYEDAEVWERRQNLRRLNRLWLDHLALVPNPAYESATVLSVRTAVVGGNDVAEPTPNRDRLALEALKAQHDELNRRWLR